MGTSMIVLLISNSSVAESENKILIKTAMAPKKKQKKKEVIGKVLRSTRKVVKQTVEVSVLERENRENQEPVIVIQEQQRSSKILVQEPERGRKTRSQEGKKKRKRKGSSRNYKIYVFRVLKQVHPELGMSSMAMRIINSLMTDMFERIADEAAKLTQYTRKRTLTSREIQVAVRLILPGELGRHAIAEGVKAVCNYMSYHSKPTSKN